MASSSQSWPQQHQVQNMKSDPNQLGSVESLCPSVGIKIPALHDNIAQTPTTGQPAIGSLSTRRREHFLNYNGQALLRLLSLAPGASRRGLQ